MGSLLDELGAVNLVESMIVAPPTKVFDNVGVIGTIGTSALIIESSEGLILMDAVNPGEYFFNVVDRGIRELGYDPYNIKYLLISHGHPDHSGCGRHLIEKYGCTPLLSKVDYEFEKGKYWDHPNPIWNFDFEINDFIEDGDVLKLGNTEIEVLSTPGHTPGGLSFIFDVYEHGEKHRAAIWGGTLPQPNREAIEQYLESFEYFRKKTAEEGVDVCLTNHPTIDGGVDRMTVLRNRSVKYIPNPYILGTDGFQKYIQMFKAMALEVLETVK